MKSNDQNIVEKSVGFNTNNTFVTDGDKDFLTVLGPELSKLGTENNTVIITDTFLFDPDSNQTKYVSDLKSLLKMLKAKSIIHSGYTSRNRVVFNDIKNELNATGCSLSINDISKAYHSRYWVCVETKKGITVDTSLNGFQTKRGYVHDAPDDEVDELLDVFGFKTENDDE